MNPLDALLAVKRLVRRLAKGCLLAIWIIVLVGLAGLAASGRASKAVVEAFNFNPTSLTLYSYLSIGNADLSPNDILLRYLRGRKQGRDNPPPIEAVLDEIFVHPSWSERFKGPAVPKGMDADQARQWRSTVNRRLIDEYESLFRRVDSQLQSLASDTSVNVEGVYMPRPPISEVFLRAKEDLPDKILLPRAAISWIKDERERKKEDDERDSLIDTFFLLTVLGAFGSLIFLTKDYIEREQTTLVAAYIFRPVLGMFLAVAVFIVDIVGHSIISTASYLQIRHETLFVLALAAGMLSEQAYEALSVRLDAALQEWKEQREQRVSASKDTANNAEGNVT